ncbi:predicted protein [Naegleria gruberi]|uniref:Nuclear transcription factor Y subunit n=1 Tax=Naegleria gruberi TaxID=5762 RepID=D2VUM5_NAEGR|nr:uncharacterized protein NAEGRDRAFT_52389 [Naegleria gruberi]EFC39535.1 predicted protein [Naegleria gruberi]|eukprot:XP_002672279.1 predicted protein [Naegleria gruberi strain NEG-M]
MAEEYTCVVDPIGNQEEDDQDDSSFISSSSDDDANIQTPREFVIMDQHHHHQENPLHHRSSVGDEQVALSILSVLPTHSSPKQQQQQSILHDPLKPSSSSSSTSTINSRGSSSAAISSAAMMRGGTQFLLQQQSSTMESSFLPPPFALPSTNVASSSAVVALPSTVVSATALSSISTTTTNVTIPSPIISQTNNVKSLPLNKLPTTATAPTPINDPSSTLIQTTTVKTSPKRKRVSSNSSNQSNPTQKGSSSARPVTTQQQQPTLQQHAYENELDGLPTSTTSAYSYPNMLHSSAMTGHGIMQPFYLAANGMSHDPNFLYSQPEMHWYSYPNHHYWNYYQYSQQPGIPTSAEEEQPESLVQDYSNNQANAEADNSQQNVEGTIYVNPKQYQRILKRRVARAKLEQQMKNAGQYKDKSYKYNSRHEWAKKRARGPGGRFLSKKEKQELEEREKEGSIAEPPTQPQPPPKPKKQPKKKTKIETSTQNNNTSLIAATVVLKTISKISIENQNKRRTIIKILVLQSGLFGCFLFEAFAAASGVAQEDPQTAHFALGYSTCNSLGILIFACTALALYTPFRALSKKATTNIVENNHSSHNIDHPHSLRSANNLSSSTLVHKKFSTLSRQSHHATTPRAQIPQFIEDTAVVAVVETCSNVNIDNREAGKNQVSQQVDLCINGEEKQPVICGEEKDVV